MPPAGQGGTAVARPRGQEGTTAPGAADACRSMSTALASSSSPLSSPSLDAALAAQRSSARLVDSPDSASAFASRAHALFASGHLDRAAHEFGLALRLTRAAASAAAVASSPSPETPQTVPTATATPPSPRSSQRQHATLLADEAVLCSCRSEAFSRLASATRSIPAAQSEARALFGLDPTHLAELALRDARRASSLAGTWAVARAGEGRALHLLERFADAREAFLGALELDPSCEGAAEGLKRAEEALLADDGGARASSSTAARASRAVSSALRLDDAECAVCSRLLFEPVTTPCGHSFCRGCLARARDHRATRCPMCRATMHLSSSLVASTALAALLERAFPDEYAARRREEEEEAAGGGAAEEAAAAASVPAAAADDAAPLPRSTDRTSSAGQEAETATLPLFVMACMLPNEHMALNIFEPRYRLMVRRVMEGSRRFGMATVDPRTGSLRRVGCEVEVLECQPQPDGRFYLEIVGRRRFRVRDDWEVDGYRVCTATFFGDSPPADEAAASEVASLCSSVEALADAWVKRARAAGRSDPRVLDVLARAGDKPPPGAHEALSFWVANLIPTGGDFRAWAAEETSTRARLARQLSELRALGEPGGGDGGNGGGDSNAGCVVM